MATRKRGSITPKGPDKWLVRAFVTRTPDGKKKYASRQVTGSYSEAQKALAKLHVEIDEVKYTGPSSETLEGYARSYITGKSIEPKTRRQYLERLTTDIFPKFGARRLQDLTRLQLQEHFQWLAGAPRSLSARTRQYTYQVLKQVLEQARRDGLILRNPMEDVERPKLKRSSKVHKIRPLDDDEVASLLQATEGTKHHALWLFLVTTGVRPSEAMGLEWRNVFLEDELPHVLIEQALSEDENGELDIRATKTESSVRRVTLPQSTVRALGAHRIEQTRYMMRWERRTTFVLRLRRGHRWLWMT